MISTSLPFMWGGSLSFLYKSHISLLPPNVSTALISGGTYSVIFAFLSFSTLGYCRQLYGWVLNSWKSISSFHLEASHPLFNQGEPFPGPQLQLSCCPFLLWGLFHRVYLWISGRAICQPVPASRSFSLLTYYH